VTIDLSAPGVGGLQGKHFPLTVISQSMAKTFKRCPLQAKYKYMDELSPRVVSKPLTRGKWFHTLLEEHYAPADDPNADRVGWEAAHKRMAQKFSGLFDEEKEELGDLPREMKSLMESYLWHYRHDSSWTVHEVEKTIEVPLPFLSGISLKLRLDMLVEDEYGLWIVDHKTHKAIPKTTDRLLDLQSPLYVWACHEVGIPVHGFKWNYVRTKAPSEPKMAYVGTPRQRLSQAACDTDYVTFVKTIKAHQRDYGLKITPDIKAWADRLKSQRYDYHKPVQTSEFFLRITLERSEDMIQRALRELHHTAKRFLEYDFSEEWVERNQSRDCNFMCGYRDLCLTEYMGGNADLVRRKSYIKQDPWAYYEEGKPDAPVE
jgi:hypothetical protein